MQDMILSLVQQGISKGAILCIFALGIAGCANVFYLGEEFVPTTEVDFYYAEEAIEKPYKQIGHGLGSGFWVSNRKIKSKLIEEAKARGADAILLTGLGKSNVLIGSRLNADEKQLNAVFLRYR